MSLARSNTGLTVAERGIVRLVSAIQFINILDFIMVMPLGPDFATALGIPTNLIGYVGGAYTAAAFLSGFAGSLYLDRLDRRKALAVAMTGLVCATALGGLSTGFTTLIIARIMAGAFGGPASALSLAIVTDAVAPERRGRAMGIVGGAFSAASVLGVPIGLQLAVWGGWRLPFFAVAAFGFAVIFAAIRIMRPQRGHLEGLPPFHLGQRLAAIGRIAARPATKLAMILSVLGLFGNFLLIPNLSTYFQFNLGYPRGDLSWLYACGDAVSFFSQRYAGRLVDRMGGTRVTAVISVLLIALYYATFIRYSPVFPVLLLFTLFMTINSARFVVVNTVTSKVPAPEERAGFMSLMSAIQHLGSSSAAFVSSLILVERPGGALDYMPRLALLSIMVTGVLPFPVRALEIRLPGLKKNVAVERTLTLTEFE